MIDVIITSCNRHKEATQTIYSLLSNNDDVRIIVIGNKSMSQAKAVNKGFEIIKSKYFVAMHNDVIIEEPGWIDRGIKFLEENPKVGLICAAGWNTVPTNNNVIASLRIPNRNDITYMTEDFIKVFHTDAIVNICRNLGLRANEKVGRSGTLLCMEYLHLGYELYAMRFENGTHLTGSALKHGTVEKNMNRSMHSQEFHKKRIEYNLDIPARGKK